MSYDDTQQDRNKKQDRNTLLEPLARILLGKRDEAVQYRASTGVERRWREEEEAYAGMDAINTSSSMLDYATGVATRTGRVKGRRSQVIVNVIRGRCETAEGRFCDIMLPTDDRNWGMKPTPNPELSAQIHDDRPAFQQGQAVTNQAGEQSLVSDVAKDKRAKAKEANDNMELEIADQTVECDYNGEQRKGVAQAAKLGTMILKGPTIVKSTRRSWSKQTSGEDEAYISEMSVESQPATKWVDCWNAYPSPGTTSNIQKSCEYMYERDEILPRHVRDLIGVEGYFDDQLVAVLAEEPYRTSIGTKKGEVGMVIHTREARGKAYEYWEYNGGVGRDEMEALGLELSDNDPSQQVSACVIFINERVVKVELNPLETGEIIYDFWQWSRVSNDSPWGIGVTRQMIWLQGIITAAWRAMMDNAGDSAGCDVIVSKMLTPAGDGWQIGGKTFWFGEDNLDDARKAFAQFQIKSMQPELQNIIELALRFVDLETSLPTIFQGEMQEVPETLGQTNIMVDSSNVGLRNRVKLYDDYITDPHITRYYHHNMLHNPKSNIKGDFQVDARGVRVLLEKDQQAQIIAELIALKGDPHFNREINWEKTARQYVKARKLDVLKTEDELKEYDDKMADTQDQPQDPHIVAAQIRAEASVQSIQVQADTDMAELEFKAAEAELDRGHQREIKIMELKVKLMDYSTKSNINIDKLKTQLAISDRSLKTQERLSEKKGTVESKAKQIVKPPTEPAGHAADGHAYEA